MGGTVVTVSNLTSNLAIELVKIQLVVPASESHNSSASEFRFKA